MITAPILLEKQAFHSWSTVDQCTSAGICLLWRFLNLVGRRENARKNASSSLSGGGTFSDDFFQYAVHCAHCWSKRENCPLDLTTHGSIVKWGYKHNHTLAVTYLWHLQREACAPIGTKPGWKSLAALWGSTIWVQKAAEVARLKGGHRTAIV